jgi:hypothetical protein
MVYQKGMEPKLALEFILYISVWARHIRPRGGRDTTPHTVTKRAFRISTDEHPESNSFTQDIPPNVTDITHTPTHIPTIQIWSCKYASKRTPTKNLEHGKKTNTPQANETHHTAAAATTNLNLQIGLRKQAPKDVELTIYSPPPTPLPHIRAPASKNERPKTSKDQTTEKRTQLLSQLKKDEKMDYIDAVMRILTAPYSPSENHR